MSALKSVPATALVADTTSVSVALQQNTLGVGFSGSGFLILYLTGVSAMLRQLRIINNSTKVAGASGGAVTAASICSNTATGDEYTSNINTLKACRVANNCVGTLDAVLRLNLAFTGKIGAWNRCKNKLYIGITQAQPAPAWLLTGPRPDPGLLLGPNWSNDLQLINAVATSSFLPGRSASLMPVTAAMALDGIPTAYDGYYTQQLPTPPGVTYAITVSALRPGVPITLATSFGAQYPFYKLWGYLPLDPAPVNPISPIRPDIYPGLSGPIKFTDAQWASFALNVADDTTLQYIYDQGRRDAAAFVGTQKLASTTAIQAALTATTSTKIVRKAAAMAAAQLRRGITTQSMAAAYGEAAVLNTAASDGSMVPQAPGPVNVADAAGGAVSAGAAGEAITTATAGTAPQLVEESSG